MTRSVPNEPPIAWPPSTPIIDATRPAAAIRSTSPADRASSSRSGLRRTMSRSASTCSSVMVTARSAGRSEGTYTDQNWPPTPPAAMRGRSVMRVGSAGSRPWRSSHSRSLWPSMRGAARMRSSTAVGCYRASPIDRQPDPERSWLKESHPGTRKDSALFRFYVKRGPDVRVDTSPRGELERLYRSQRGRMWQAVFAFAGDPEVASDAVAEAFAQALRRGDALRSPRALALADGLPDRRWGAEGEAARRPRTGGGHVRDERSGAGPGGGARQALRETASGRRAAPRRRVSGEGDRPDHGFHHSSRACPTQPRAQAPPRAPGDRRCLASTTTST